MTDPLFDVDDGRTPLDDDEAQGLRPTWVRTRGDLNEAERDNILRARRALRTVALDEVLDDLWLRDLHRRMFGEVWIWAGRHRTTERNMGIEPAQIAGAVRSLTRDCRHWIDQDSTELVVARFHHRLVFIHPFPNGNGRHARAAADYLAGALGAPVPTWGISRETDTGALRVRYLSALRAADRDGDDVEELIAVIWS
ncbi:MAG: mobile mystery protein B [Acidimicrobiales bacterium]